MSDRVSATIVIGGPVPAARLADLVQAIEDEAVGPDWDGGFESPDALLAHLAKGAEGVSFCRHEVASGEFDGLQQLCVELGLTYVLTYGGYGGQWSPARRIRRPGGVGDGVACSLEADGGRACVSADDIRCAGWTDLGAVLAHLDAFDDPHVPALTIKPAEDGRG